MWKDEERMAEVHQMVSNSKRMKTREIERELGLVVVEVGRIGSIVSWYESSNDRRRGKEGAIAAAASAAAAASRRFCVLTMKMKKQ